MSETLPVCCLRFLFVTSCMWLFLLLPVSIEVEENSSCFKAEMHTKLHASIGFLQPSKKQLTQLLLTQNAFQMYFLHFLQVDLFVQRIGKHCKTKLF